MRANPRANIEDLKALGVEELERRAKEAHTHIRALDYDESPEGIEARNELIRMQNLLNEARSALLEDEDLPEPVVVGMKSAFMKPRFEIRGGTIHLRESSTPSVQTDSERGE